MQLVDYQGGSAWAFFLAIAGFLFWWNLNRIQILCNENLFSKDCSSILRDQPLIELIKILQVFDGQDHLSIRTGFEL